MKSIMYHYVRDKSPKLKIRNYLDFDVFCKQLDFFEKEYGIFRMEDFQELALGKKPTKNKVILTFDDGLSDHYDFVLPELVKRKITGIFYISSYPYEQKRLIDVHRVHYLIANFDSKLLLDDIINLCGGMNINENHFLDKTYLKQNNDSNITEIKRILNYYMSSIEKTVLLDRIFSHYCIDEKELLWDFYIKEENLKEFIESGQIIGNHTFSHQVLSSLNESSQTEEICKTHQFIRSLGKQEINTFCYPYGGDHVFNDFTHRILNDIDTDFSFSVESRDITQNDLDCKRLSLPRYDCNEFMNI